MADVVKDAQHKTCTRCSVSHPISMFGVSRKNPDGIKRWCIACCRAHLSAWTAANPELVAARKMRYAVRNKDRLNAVSAARRASDPEKTQRYWDSWRKAHPEAKNRAALKWAKRNPEKLAEQSAKRRAKKAQATPIWFDDEFEKFAIKEAYDIAMKRSKATGIRHDVDHIVPLISSLVCGLHCADNLRVIPSRINKSKGNRHWPGMPT